MREGINPPENNPQLIKLPQTGPLLPQQAEPQPTTATPPKETTPPTTVPLSEIMQEKGVLFISVLDHDASSPIAKTDATEEIEELRSADQPKHYATSTFNIKTGTPVDLIGQGTRAAVAVFFTEGDIVKAYPCDAGTDAQGMSAPELEAQYVTGKTILEQITTAIDDKLPGDHNEVIIKAKGDQVGGIIVYPTQQQHLFEPFWDKYGK